MCDSPLFRLVSSDVLEEITSEKRRQEVVGGQFHGNVARCVIALFFRLVLMGFSSRTSYEARRKRGILKISRKYHTLVSKFMDVGTHVHELKLSLVF